jgi:hypothetical protein
LLLLDILLEGQQQQLNLLHYCHKHLLPVVLGE